MSFLKVTPTSANSLVIELYQWNGKEYVCVGEFEAISIEDTLEIMGAKDWRTQHRNELELTHYVNEPIFHKETIGVFHSIKIKEKREDK